MTAPQRDWPRRVVHILRYAQGRGGTETHALHLATAQVQMGIRTLAVLAEDATSDELEQQFRAAGSEVVRQTIDTRDGNRELPRRLLKLIRILRAFKPDVVHLHSGGHTGGLPHLVVAKLFTNAVVIHTEHLFPREKQHWRFRPWKRIGDSFVDGLIAVSRSNAQFRRTHSDPPENRFAAILNGILAPALPAGLQQQNRERVRREWQIPEDALVYGVISRLVDWKGVDWAIRAFALLPRDRGPYLMIVGEGPEAPALKKLAEELSVADRVRFTGYQSKPLEFADALDVYVDAIPVSSGSMALIEAMSRGLPPIITTTAPEEAVIHEESGLRAPACDPPGLAAAMQRLADDRYRLELGRKAKAHFERHFTAERMARDTVEVYRSARRRTVPQRLRADGPLNPRPGDSV